MVLLTGTLFAQVAALDFLKNSKLKLEKGRNMKKIAVLSFAAVMMVACGMDANQDQGSEVQKSCYNAPVNVQLDYVLKSGQKGYKFFGQMASTEGCFQALALCQQTLSQMKAGLYWGRCSAQ